MDGYGLLCVRMICLLMEVEYLQHILVPTTYSGYHNIKNTLKHCFKINCSVNISLKGQTKVKGQTKSQIKNSYKTFSFNLIFTADNL